MKIWSNTLILTLFLTCWVIAASAQLDIDTTNNPTKTDSTSEVNTVKATFVGGEAELYSYITNHIVIPPCAFDCLSGAAYSVSFVIEKDGSVSNVEIVKRRCHYDEEEVEIKTYYTPREKRERAKSASADDPPKVIDCVACCKEAEAAAILAVEGMPIWIPASMEGKLVRMRYSLPIRFNM